ncbi:MAG: hypothetical protein QOI76_2462 [Frankiales bacterium]|jgi:hypothetical protein|nr:hypothetical protein [Frankiales bacterium]
MPTKKMDAKRAAKARRMEIEAAKRAAHAADRRRSWLIAGAAVTVGILLIVAVELPRWTAPTPIEKRSLSQLGVSVAKAACSADTARKVQAKGNLAATDKAGKATTIKYTEVPPTSGKSYATGAAAGTHYYAAGQGPTPETLVRNLQNGYTVLWYTASLPKNQLAQLSYVGDAGAKVALSEKFIVTPWDIKLGKFPAGKNVAIAAWGSVQFCGGVNGKTVQTFINNHPPSKAPTPTGA